MNREETIANILKSRKVKSVKIRERLCMVKKISNALSNFKGISSHVRKIIEDPETCSRFDELDKHVSEVEEKVNGLENELTNLEKRTERNTLNIGVVGRPRMGKSTFLQSLTGLDNKVIPSGNVDYVTGACSHIRHDDSKNDGDAHAVITPYTKQEFLEHVITPFTESLGMPKLLGVHEIPDMELPDEKQLQQSAELIKQRGRLENLKRAYSEYEDLLDSGTQEISKDHILSYIAQSDGNGKTYSKWYAIKDAEIYCKFPQSDIGSIMVCDTPGLGDFTPGAEKALVERLGSTIDVIFILKKLDSTGQVVTPEDAQFYDIISRAYSSIDAADWSYMLLNCMKGDVPAHTFIEDLKNSMKTREGVYQIDASDKDSVADAFNHILTDIVEQVKVLDDKLIRNYEQMVKEVRPLLDSLIHSAKKVLPVRKGATNALVQSDTNTVLSNLVGKLMAYREQLRKEGVGSLTPVLKETIDRMRKTNLELEYNNVDAQNPGSWMESNKKRLRAKFIGEFSKLDESMEDLLKTFRQQLQGILADEEGGRMSFVADDEKGTFWGNLKKRIFDEVDDPEPLNMAIDNILNMKLNFRAFILPHLTEILEGLTNNRLPEDSPFVPFTFNQQEDDIDICKRKLERAWQLAIGLCDKIFNGRGSDGIINTTPTRALVALVDEFYLLWLCHKNSNNTWSSFYAAYKEEAWPKKYGSENSVFVSAQKWDRVIKDFSATISELN